MFRFLILSTFIASSTLAQTLMCPDSSLPVNSNGDCFSPDQTVRFVNADGITVCCTLAEAFTVAPPTTITPPTTVATSIATDAAGSTVVVTVTGASTTRSGSATTTRSSSTTCVDKLNPQTGVSDCPARASLCTDSNYVTIMRDQCPKTCGYCSSSGTTGSTGSCVDLVNPKTGVSDCLSLAYLCNDSNYATLMTTQCPKTCGKCTSSGSSSATTSSGTATTTARTRTCVDKVNPATGVSDCPRRRSLCTNSVYQDLMRSQCPLTCGFC